MAPELITWKRKDKGAVDLMACDMWALGVTLNYTLWFDLPLKLKAEETPSEYKKWLTKLYTDPKFKGFDADFLSMEFEY